MNWFAGRSGKTVRLSDEALGVLQNRAWDGNVRELEHTIERAVALTFDGELKPESCSDEFSAASHNGRSFALPADGLDLKEFLAGLEKELVSQALARTGGNQTRAAELLKLQVHAFRHLIEKHKS